ncbi:MAG: hypothetical protein ABIH85_01365 [Candidatus Omnitrophota bacterium]|nr:hypothetical protein [Candidatus Omnitrophota bacterium]MBU1894278.1 hypothetical protein [Candidatus Omnitrophota bacterium]
MSSECYLDIKTYKPCFASCVYSQVPRAKGVARWHGAIVAGARADICDPM